VEVRLDSADGPKIGEGVFSIKSPGPQPGFNMGQSLITIDKQTDGQLRSVYFVTNPIKVGEPIAILFSAEFKTK
jgi:hypothetical protein